MSNLFRKRRPTTSGTAIGPSSSKKQRLIDSTKVLLDVAKESSDWFPPLKSCLGGITALIKHYDQSEDVKDKLEELIPWVTKLQEGLATADPKDDQQEVERRTQLTRSLEDIAQKSQTLSAKGKPARLLDKTQDAREAGRLVEQLRQAILVYQVSQQQAINNQVAQLASSLNVLLGLHEKLPGVRGKIASALARLDRLRAGVGTMGNAEESKQQMILFDTLEGINNELQSLSNRSSAAGYQENDTDIQTLCELMENIRDTILEYQHTQFAQQKVLHEHSCRLIDAAESLVLNHCHCAKGAGYQHGDRQGCLTGTRECVLNEIECWTEDFDKSPVFWLNGLAGTGKSTIAQTIAERTFANGQLGASFFCSRGFEDRSNLKSIFPTLAFQLAQKHTSFRSSLIPLLQSNPDIIHESLQDQMQKLLVGPLQSAGVSTVIVIDALDECRDEDPESAILLVLGQLVSEIPGVKFFVTSRPETHIMTGFRGPLLGRLTEVFILHNVEPCTVNKDICHFFKHELSRLAQQCGGIQGWPTDGQLDELCQGAAGYFVYAVATVNFLKHKFQSPVDRLDMLLKSSEGTTHEGRAKLKSHTSLNSLYTSILQMAFHGNDDDDDIMVCSVLSAVVLVTNPLSPSAIATLMGFQDGLVHRLLRSIQSLLLLPEDSSSPVQPFHKSFPDFLTDSARCLDQRFYISPNYHIELVLCCLKLMDRSLKKNMCSIPDYALNCEVGDLAKRIDEGGIHGALEYACRSWHKHLIVTDHRTVDVVSALRCFLEQKFLLWLEGLSVLGAVGGAVDSLNMITKWLKEVHIPSDINPLLETATDCLRFITEFFEVINQSVPHIYHSALSHAPQSSIVQRLYGQQACSPVERVVTGVPASWESCTASVQMLDNHEHRCAIWLPCGQSVAVSIEEGIEIHDSNTLERKSCFKTPGHLLGHLPDLLVSSPDGHLLVCPYYTYVGPGHDYTLVVWDTQTGVVIREFEIEDCYKIMFHGDQRTITCIGYSDYTYTYDVLDGSQLWGGRADSSPFIPLGVHWTNEDTLWFVATSESDGELVVNIHELQPAGPLLVAFSFPSPPESGCFSFSPVSFHASFISENGVTIFDVQDSKLLLQTQVDLEYNSLLGEFSPDGVFFAFEPSQGEIIVWQNAPTGYVPWRSLRFRFSPSGFSWSPTSTSILCWSVGGIWLLDPGNHSSPSLSSEVQPANQYCKHMVAYSADRVYIATVWEYCGVVTILNCISGTSWEFTDTEMRIQDVRIVDNIIFAVDNHQLVGWALDEDKAVHGVPSARRVIVDETLAISGDGRSLTLSHDCSQVAFMVGAQVFLYDAKTQQTICGCMTYGALDIRFSPDGLYLWFHHSHHGYSYVGLEVAGSWDSNQVIQGGQNDGQILFNLTSPCGYHVGLQAKWVTDPSSRKLLWLPPSWRTEGWRGMRWDDNFLALLNGCHPRPVIIKFKHQLFLPHSHPSGLLGT